jgi:hypothetical protein
LRAARTASKIESKVAAPPTSSRARVALATGTPQAAMPGAASSRRAGGAEAAASRGASGAVGVRAPAPLRKRLMRCFFRRCGPKK